MGPTCHCEGMDQNGEINKMDQNGADPVDMILMNRRKKDVDTVDTVDTIEGPKKNTMTRQRIQEVAGKFRVSTGKSSLLDNGCLRRQLRIAWPGSAKKNYHAKASSFLFFATWESCKPCF